MDQFEDEDSKRPYKVSSLVYQCQSFCLALRISFNNPAQKKSRRDEVPVALLFPFATERGTSDLIHRPRLPHFVLMCDLISYQLIHHCARNEAGTSEMSILARCNLNKNIFRRENVGQQKLFRATLYLKAFRSSLRVQKGMFASFHALYKNCFEKT